MLFTISMSYKRSSLLTRQTGFKPRVGQIKTSCHPLATHATLYCVPWRKLRQCSPRTRYTLNCEDVVLSYENNKLTLCFI